MSTISFVVGNGSEVIMANVQETLVPSNKLEVTSIMTGTK